MTNNQKTKKETQQQGRAVIYTRPGRSQAAPEMQTPQATDLLLLAQEHGFTDVRVFTDEYTPGTAPIGAREMLQALLHSITNPEEDTAPIRAIFVLSEDRLFRDATLADISAFIETCCLHRVLLITPLAEYDFTNQAHIAYFRHQVTQGYEFVTHMIVQRLQAGKRAARARRQATRK